MATERSTLHIQNNTFIGPCIKLTSIWTFVKAKETKTYFKTPNS
jgi:hypothetical protein